MFTIETYSACLQVFVWEYKSFLEGVPILTKGSPFSQYNGDLGSLRMGIRVPILSVEWGPGSPFHLENGDPGPHFTGRMGTRGPCFRGYPFYYDVGTTHAYMSSVQTEHP